MLVDTQEQADLRFSGTFVLYDGPAGRFFLPLLTCMPSDDGRILMRIEKLNPRENSLFDERSFSKCESFKYVPPGFWTVDINSKFIKRNLKLCGFFNYNYHPDGCVLSISSTVARQQQQGLKASNTRVNKISSGGQGGYNLREFFFGVAGSTDMLTNLLDKSYPPLYDMLDKGLLVGALSPSFWYKCSDPHEDWDELKIYHRNVPFGRILDVRQKKDSRFISVLPKSDWLNQAFQEEVRIN